MTVNYITAELASKTNNKRILEAYQRNYLSVVTLDNKYFYMECTPGSDAFLKIIKSEIKKHFPYLIYLYDIR